MLTRSNYTLPRLLAQITRLLSRFSLFGVREYQHVISGEHLCEINFRITQKISDIEIQDIIDARTQFPRSHVFEPRYVVEIERAVWDLKTGMGFSPRTKIGIKETSSWTLGNLQNTAVPLSTRVPSLSGEHILLPSNGFYHWLIEDLPTFLPLLNSQKEILVWKNAPKYVFDFLKIIDVPYAPVGRFIEVNSVSIVSKNEDSGWASRQDVEVLRTFFKEYRRNREKSKKVYISRVSSSRTQVWERELQSLLVEDGWSVIELQTLDLEAQINLISTANVIAGIHGAGLSHMVWMNPASLVIELGGSGYRTCYTSLARACGHQYERIQFRDSNEYRSTQSAATDLNLAISKLSNKD